MDLLEEMTEAVAPPSFEDEIREICTRELTPLVDDIRTDAMGNLIAFKKGALEGDRQKIMLAGHMDEIGFLVRFIDENGFLRLNPAGGFDPKTLIAKRVVVMGNPRASPTPIRFREPESGFRASSIPGRPGGAHRPGPERIPREVHLRLPMKALRKLEFPSPPRPDPVGPPE